MAVAWHRVPFTMGCFGEWTEESREQHYDNLCAIDGRIALAGEHASYLPAWQEGAVTSALDAIGRAASRAQSPEVRHESAAVEIPVALAVQPERRAAWLCAAARRNRRRCRFWTAPNSPTPAANRFTAHLPGLPHARRAGRDRCRHVSGAGGQPHLASGAVRGGRRAQRRGATCRRSSRDRTCMDSKRCVHLALDDAQIADVVNYVRSHFGNHYADKLTRGRRRAAASERGAMTMKLSPVCQPACLAARLVAARASAAGVIAPSDPRQRLPDFRRGGSARGQDPGASSAARCRRFPTRRRPRAALPPMATPKTQTVACPQRASRHSLKGMSLRWATWSRCRSSSSATPAKDGKLDFAGFMKGYTQFFGTSASRTCRHVRPCRWRRSQGRACWSRSRSPRSGPEARHLGDAAAFAVPYCGAGGSPSVRPLRDAFSISSRCRARAT